MTDKILNGKELAEKLAINVQVLRRQCKAGLLPHVKIGKQIRIARSDFDKYIETVREPKP